MSMSMVVYNNGNRITIREIFTVLAILEDNIKREMKNKLRDFIQESSLEKIAEQVSEMILSVQLQYRYLFNCNNMHIGDLSSRIVDSLYNDIKEDISLTHHIITYAEKPILEIVYPSFLLSKSGEAKEITEYLGIREIPILIFLFERPGGMYKREIRVGFLSRELPRTRSKPISTLDDLTEYLTKEYPGLEEDIRSTIKESENKLIMKFKRYRWDVERVQYVKVDPGLYISNEAIKSEARKIVGNILADFIFFMALSRTKDKKRNLNSIYEVIKDITSTYLGTSIKSMIDEIRKYEREIGGEGRTRARYNIFI